MYIQPFWAGVLCTILVEVIVMIVWAINMASKNNRG